jgi:hypothetical protein
MVRDLFAAYRTTMSRFGNWGSYSRVFCGTFPSVFSPNQPSTLCLQAAGASGHAETGSGRCAAGLPGLALLAVVVHSE